MAPERLNQIKGVINGATNYYVNGEPCTPVLSAETARELLAEVERLQARLALIEGVAKGLGERYWRLARALQQIAQDTAKGPRHDWALQNGLHQIARDALNGVDPATETGT